MNKSEILFVLRNHFHRFNQNELKFIFNNTIKRKLNVKKYELVYDMLYFSENRTLELFDDGDVEWSINHDYREVLHNDLGPAAHHGGVKKYLLWGELAEWNVNLQKTVL